MRNGDKDIKEAAARFDRRTDEIERNPDAAKIEHLSDLHAVASAAVAVQSAQASLVEAVEISRAHGRSWNELAVALDVSRQAARQRYGITSNTPKKPVEDRRKAGSRPGNVAVAKKNAVAKRARKTA
jgi:hypothetical protein